ncbi:MAG: tRNA-dihydrouridine synthase [Deltaproteobacteria bacterium]|nr:tRNA-dihydrouridine synthase [Deltaproteobacteria bacterium]
MPNPFIVAPMAGLTNWPYRRLCLERGAAMAVTEMASAVALAHHGRQTLRLIATDPNLEKTLCVQLFGKDPGVLAEAAKVSVNEAGAKVIDLNFCCPARKVISSGHGGALLKDADLCRRIVAKVSESVSVPVTVKLRPGFLRLEGPMVLELGPKLEEAGAAALTLHPRYVSDRFEGQADWSLITRLSEAVTIPVIGSGDIHGPEEAARALAESGAAAVMIGRASRGRPWIFRQCLEYLSSGRYRPATTSERLSAALTHARLLEAEAGPKAAYRLRSILTWYTKDLPGAAALRAAICREDDVGRQLSLLTEAMEAGGPKVWG